MKTMKKIFMLVEVLLISGLAFSIYHSTIPIVATPSTNSNPYKQFWASVDSLDRLGQPKSALEIVEKIYVLAKQQQNNDQIIKAFIHRLKYKNTIEENAFENMLKELKSEIPNQKFPNDAMMETMLAEMYWWYYQNNRYVFQDRTNTINFNQDDIKTWSLNQLADVVIEHYIKSLKNKELLQKTALLKEYEECINEGTKPTNLRPTMYDFLAHRAIDFFSNSELTLSKPADAFYLKEDYYFSDAEVFAKQKIETSDTLSLHFYGIKILQDLISFRVAENDNEALADAELKRLKFVYSNSVNPNKDILYFNYLKKMSEEYTSYKISAEIDANLAEYYVTRASKYQKNVPLTHIYKNDKITAANICKNAIKKYPNSEGAEKCQVIIDGLENHQLSLTVESVVPVNEMFAGLVSYKNTEKLWLRMATIDMDKVARIREKTYDYKELYDEFYKEANELYVKNLSLPDEKIYQSYTTEILFDKLMPGTYVVFAANNDKFSYNKNMTSYTFFRVSNITFISQKDKNGDLNVQLLHRKTGSPLPDVKAEAYKLSWNSLQRRYVKEKYKNYTSDANGYFKVEAQPSYETDNLKFDFEYGSDFLSSDNSYYLYQNQNYIEYNTNVSIFTDRAIYRPGQTVFYKGIGVVTNGDEKRIATGQVRVSFLDPNGQSVGESSLNYNEFGTFNGSFTIPTGQLNGSFTISSYHGSKVIQVEEYKRPKFEAKLNDFTGNYRLEDVVTVTGNAKAYAGNNITDANVKYRIVRTPLWSGWWSWYIPNNPTEILNGTTKTDDFGKFEIKFNAIPDLSIVKSPYVSFDYQVIVDVTDLNGETQSTSGNIIVGYNALRLDADIDEMVLKSKIDTFEINTINLNQEFIPAQGVLKIHKLKSSSQTLKKRYWGTPDTSLFSMVDWQSKFPGNEYTNELDIRNLPIESTVFEEKFNTNKSTKIYFKTADNISLGQYMIEMESKDFFGNPITHKEFFTVYDNKNNALPFKTPFWSVAEKTYCEPGQNAIIWVGSGYDSTKIMYEIEHKGKIISKKWLTINNEQKKLEIPIIEEYRGDITAHITFVKENRFYNQSYPIYVPYSNKKLNIEFSTFRDKLQPGQNEEWTIKIKGNKGEKVAAEMMATLYDASLDAFANQYWNFDVFQSYYAERTWAAEHFTTQSSTLMSYDYDSYHSTYTRAYDGLFWFGFSYYQYRYYDDFLLEDSESATGGVGFLRKEKSVISRADNLRYLETKDEMSLSPISIADKSLSTTTNSPGGVTGKQDMKDVKTRTNFNETAFFYPNLYTDTEGNVNIKFTIPESLTKWKMMGLAHTKDLKSGWIEKTLVTQKDLMLMPNPPRFFRENDIIEFPVKVSNISDKDMEGTVLIEFLDAVSLKPIENIFADKDEQSSKKFKVGAKLNTNLTWKLKIPEGVSMITYKVIGKAGSYSDGEERPLPVLTNRMLVTESLPLPVRGNMTKIFTFDKLLNNTSTTLRHHKLTLEFTSNPAWYAVQALPYLMEYPYECIEQTFSRYYANTLSSYIANSDPKVKRVFDAWKANPNSKALVSNLEKNEDLKSVLLQETPWVMQGKNETDRKNRLGLLFDLNRMANEMEIALDKIVKAQAANGGFPWFPGMREDRYMTQHILTGMGHLNHLGVIKVNENDRLKNLCNKAMDYLDYMINEDYQYLKRNYTPKQMEENHLNQYVIQYLYARSYFLDNDVRSRSKEAFDYFKGQAQKYWLSQSMYMQGMISLSLHRYKDEKIPLLITKSIKEKSINNEELGMYWKENESGMYWYEAPIEVAALMVEVFDEVANDETSVNDLKVWLLKQKQTQDWKTTKATVEAIYALLQRGGNWLTSDELCKITVGTLEINKQNIPDLKTEEGTGYFRTSWYGSEIKNEMGKVTVQKTDAGVSWGALYWQYFEQLDKITPHETPLKINKKLFVERLTGSGPVIEPVTDNTKLVIGDKIVVRIEIRVDRDMEYVHLKDMRSSGFEPINVISQYKYQGGLGYYESTKDASTNFFMDRLNKGTYVFEYPLRVQHAGDFSNGITTMQCMYAPEFTTHSEGVRVKVGK